MRSPTTLTAVLGFAAFADLASARSHPRWRDHKNRLSVDVPRGSCGAGTGSGGGAATAVTYDGATPSTGVSSITTPGTGGSVLTPPAFAAQPTPSADAGGGESLVEGDDGEASGGDTGYLSSTSSTSLGGSSTSGAAAPVATPSGGGGNSTNPADCKCGYSKGGSFFPQLFSIDFRTANTAAAISAAGMYVTDTFEWQVGAVSADGTTAYGQASNIRPASNADDGIEMVVPGGQSGNKVTCAEIAWQAGGKGMTKIFTEIEMQIDPTPGTCQSIFTYIKDHETANDELDIEILSSSIMQKSAVADAGVQLTNHNPAKEGSSDFRIIPFETDPTQGFNKYSIDWSDGKVQYAMNGKAWNGPTNFVSVNPSYVIVNHCGDHGFFGAPMPSKDAVMKVRGLKVYYAAAGDAAGMPSGCTEADVCAI